VRVLRGVALGTYYAHGADAARKTPRSSAMRGLVYAVKDNREPPNPPQPVEHPFHPAPNPVRVDRHNALEYVATIADAMRTHLLKYFGVEDASAVTLVPVPSSEVTLATQSTARFRRCACAMHSPQPASARSPFSPFSGAPWNRGRAETVEGFSSRERTSSGRRQRCLVPER
jgi:hypothetical protein